MKLAASVDRNQLPRPNPHRARAAPGPLGPARRAHLARVAVRASDAGSSPRISPSERAPRASAAPADAARASAGRCLLVGARDLAGRRPLDGAIAVRSTAARHCGGGSDPDGRIVRPMEPTSGRPRGEWPATVAPDCARLLARRRGPHGLLRCHRRSPPRRYPCPPPRTCTSRRTRPCSTSWPSCATRQPSRRSSARSCASSRGCSATRRCRTSPCRRSPSGRRSRRPRPPSSVSASGWSRSSGPGWAWSTRCSS